MDSLRQLGLNVHIPSPWGLHAFADPFWLVYLKLIFCCCLVIRKAKCEEASRNYYEISVDG